MSVLSAPSQLAKSVATSFRGRGRQSAVSSSGLFVEAFTRDNISVGVGIEAIHSQRPPLWPKSCNLSVFARNMRSRRICIVSHNDTTAVVKMIFHAVLGPFSSHYVELRFCAPRFFAAFRDGAPDLAALEQCIISSWVGYTTRLMAGCECATVGCIECRGAAAAPSSLLSHEAFVHIVEARGCTLKAVLGFYEEGKLVSATPTFAVIDRQHSFRRVA